MNDSEFENALKRQLDQAVPVADELTRARLRAARMQAMDAWPQRRRPWWQAGVVAASLALAAVLGWQLQDNGPEQVADAEVIADLDLVLWLDNGDV